jgi:hypothetical protein
MVRYEPYSTGYLVWFPGSKRIEKARNVIFHENAVAPVTPILYEDEGKLKSASQLTKMEQSEAPESRLVSNIPDFPRGVTRSGKIRDESGVRSMLEENIEHDEEVDELVLFSAMTKDPTIVEALSMPGEEGIAWEAACQAEWKNMLEHKVFGPPEEPPLGTKVLKTGTVC